MDESAGLTVGERYNRPTAQHIRELIDKHDNGNAEILRKYLGCSAQTVSQYRNGEMNPKLENLIKIADKYDVSVDWILGRNEVSTINADVQCSCLTTQLSEKAVETLFENKELADLISAMIEYGLGEELDSTSTWLKISAARAIEHERLWAHSSKREHKGFNSFIDVDPPEEWYRERALELLPSIKKAVNARYDTEKKLLLEQEGHDGE